MKSLKQEYTISAPIDKVWEAFVSPKIIDKWGAGPAKMDDKPGTKFTLWGGDVHGTNVRIDKNKIIEQDWYGGNWPQPSKVRFEFESDGEKTKITLTQANIPDEELNDIDDGWRQYYLGPMKEYLEKQSSAG